MRPAQAERQNTQRRRGQLHEMLRFVQAISWVSGDR
jgi:hypothetical protein